MWKVAGSSGRAAYKQAVVDIGARLATWIARGAKEDEQWWHMEYKVEVSPGVNIIEVISDTVDEGDQEAVEAAQRRRRRPK